MTKHVAKLNNLVFYMNGIISNDVCKEMLFKRIEGI